MSHHHQRLTANSAAQIYAENPKRPMNAGFLAVLDGRPELSQLRGALDARLSHIGLMRRRLHFAPLNLGHPTWEPDEAFDICHHVEEVTVDDIDDPQQLQRAVNVLLSEPLDRSRALWSAHLLRGHGDHKSAVLLKAHQALVETLGTSQLTEAIFDLSAKADTPETWAMPPGHRPPSSRSLTEIGDALRDNAIHRLGVATQIQRTALGDNRGFDRRTMRLSTRLLWEANTRGKRPLRSLPFNRSGSGERQLHWAPLSFAQARSIRRSTGGSVNDVLLTALTEAVTRYCKRRGVSTDGRSIRVAVPVRVRSSSRSQAEADRTSYLPLHLPLDIEDPIRRLRSIHSSGHLLRDARVPETLHLAGSVMSLTPPILQAAATELWAKTPSMSFFHTVMGSLSCPHIPVFLAGEPVAAIIPVTSLTPGLGVGFAVANYCGRLWVGVTSDSAACPDAQHFVDDLQSAMDHLADAAGVDVGALDDDVAEPQRSSQRPRSRSAPKTAKRKTAKRKSA